MSIASGVSAQRMEETSLALDGWIEEDGSAVHLTWNDAARAHRGEVEVSRRNYGAIGIATWQRIDVVDQPGQRVTDTNTQIGQAYEYRVLRRSVDDAVQDVGYWMTGRDVPAQPDRGIAHIIVDDTMAGVINDHLDRFVMDLTGDGWTVRRYTMARHAPGVTVDNLSAIGAIKAQLQAAYLSKPNERHAVILVGHVPFATSGMAAPDGHAPSPHATDLIYGDVDGRWQLTQDGTLTNTALPSDAIEMQVGRIDFAQVTDGDSDQEAHLLRAYFDKNHNWRHGRLGDLREAYGEGPGLIGELNGLRNVVGPSAVTAGGHHDVGETRPWLWGVDFGDHAGRHYRERYSNMAVFAINFGSGKQRINLQNNAMIALLAQPWYTLAVGWGARPAWWLHHMALGGTIGDVHMRTVNNGRVSEPYLDSMEYIPTGLFLWRNPVWVNLLGDPTVRAFPLSPPHMVGAQIQGGDAHLTWGASPDDNITGYHVYRRGEDGSFQKISGAEPLDALSFVDTNAQPESTYMVRAFGRKEVHAGSFQTVSQGIFTQAGQPPLMAPDIEATTAIGVPLTIEQPQDEQIFSFVEGSEIGALAFEVGAWIYSPPAGFAGQVGLRYVVSDQFRSAEGTLTITVRD